MTTPLEISSRAFFSADEKPPAFHDLLVECIARRQMLSARLAPNAVVIEPADDASGELQIAGQWCVPELRHSPLNVVGIKLMLPLLINISRVRLPYDQIYTLGRPYRSVADFFARNLFLALSRGAQVAIEEDGSAKSAVNDVREFRRHYFYIVKSEFDETAFQGRNAGDVLCLVLVNAYMPALNFKNPLLKIGGEALRKLVGVEQRNDFAALREQIIDARADIMSQFGLRVAGNETRRTP